MIDYAEKDVIVRCPYCVVELGRNIGPVEAVAFYSEHMKVSLDCVISNLHDE